MSVWGDKISEAQLQIGNMLTISCEIESREYYNKWYTDVKAWKIETATVTSSPVVNNPIAITENFQLPVEEDEDLPF